MEKLTYKDFKIGQKITCVKIDNDFYDQHLTKGKIYIVEDTDFHLPLEAVKILIIYQIYIFILKKYFLITRLHIRH